MEQGRFLGRLGYEEKNRQPYRFTELRSELFAMIYRCFTGYERNLQIKTWIFSHFPPTIAALSRKSRLKICRHLVPKYNKNDKWQTRTMAEDSCPLFGPLIMNINKMYHCTVIIIKGCSTRSKTPKKVISFADVRIKLSSDRRLGSLNF